MSIATFAAAQMLRLLPRKRLSGAVGRLCDRELPAPLSRVTAKAYAAAYRVDMSEVAPRREAYPSFDAFFTRPLKTGARPIVAEPFVSPADGRIVDAGPVSDGSEIRVKGSQYGVGELVGDEGQAERYSGGSFVVVYLSPRDYHRVHSPVDGVVSQVRGVEGNLFPVNAIGERHVPKLFARNHRVCIDIDTDDLGRVAVVMVGAMIVGRISVSMIPGGAVGPGEHRLDPAVEVHKGDEIGMFHLGSTVVLFGEPGVHFSRGAGPVLYGQSLGLA